MKQYMYEISNKNLLCKGERHFVGLPAAESCIFSTIDADLQKSAMKSRSFTLYSSKHLRPINTAVWYVSYYVLRHNVLAY